MPIGLDKRVFMKWIILLLGIIANAAASILIKVSMTPPKKLSLLLNPLAALENWPFWLGLIFYCAAFLLYVVALARLPLHVAHPILTSGAIASVALLSIIFLRESFHWTTGAGIFLLIAGITLITVRAN